jgi:hypothetical protein
VGVKPTKTAAKIAQTGEKSIVWGESGEKVRNNPDFCNPAAENSFLATHL